MSIAGGVSFESFRVLSLSIVGSNPEANSANAEMQIVFKKDSDRVPPNSIEVNVIVNDADGDFFAVDLNAIGTFWFPPTMDAGERELYLRQSAPTRVLDAARQYLAQVTVPFAHGPLKIPPMAPAVRWPDKVEQGTVE